VPGRDIAGLQRYPPANRVDRETALRRYTIAGAELTGEDAAKGTITISKYADPAILSADYFSVPESDVSRIESVLTIVGGKIAYAAADYEAIAAPLGGQRYPSARQSRQLSSHRPRMPTPRITRSARITVGSAKNQSATQIGGSRAPAVDQHRLRSVIHSAGGQTPDRRIWKRGSATSSPLR
jgi:hypothetical protein